MKIHEYQAKEILKEYGIAVPAGEVVSNPIAAELVSVKLGIPVVVKAQIHAGGRGKGGGIREARSPVEAREIASQILGKKLITPQTSSGGILVEKLLIEKKLQVQKEFYLAITVSRKKNCPVIVVSRFGGKDVEETASKEILEESVDPLIGLQSFQKRKLAFAFGVSPELIPAMENIIASLYRIFEEKDCLLVEANPLILAEDHQFYAIDAKMDFDDNALFRHPEIKELVDFSAEDSLEAEAAKYGVNYVRLGGGIGCMVNGAGLAMATMDTILQSGERPANFLDVGGGAKPEQIEIAFRILLADPNVKVVLINVFGGILRYDSLVSGLLKATEKKDIENIPLVIRLEGEGAKEGLKMLKKVGLSFVAARSMEDGVRKAIRLLKESR